MVYAVTQLQPWRELTDELGWDQDHYVWATSTLLQRALLTR